MGQYAIVEKNFETKRKEPWAIPVHMSKLMPYLPDWFLKEISEIPERLPIKDLPLGPEGSCSTKPLAKAA